MFIDILCFFMKKIIVLIKIFEINIQIFVKI